MFIPSINIKSDPKQTDFSSLIVDIPNESLINVQQKDTEIDCTSKNNVDKCLNQDLQIKINKLQQNFLSTDNPPKRSLSESDINAGSGQIKEKKNTNNDKFNFPSPRSNLTELLESKFKTTQCISCGLYHEKCDSNLEKTPLYSSSFPSTCNKNSFSTFDNQQLCAYTNSKYLTIPANYTSSPKKLAPLRSFSHPNPTITNPTDSEVSNISAKRHRHSIAGQMSYFKMLGFGCGGPLGIKKLTGGSTNSLFSTAVISGSSSAPNLQEMIPNTASASAIEGFGGVPPIRPLETLHNALSMRQLDAFLEQMTSAQLFKTPSSTPPKYPSTPVAAASNISQAVSSSACSAHPPPLKLQSPCNSVGWSGPPSFLSSSSGPSSPGVSDPNSNSKESSEMSSSIVSSDGILVDNLPHMFLTELDQDLENVGILLQPDEQVTDSMEFSDYFANLQRTQHHGNHGDSGEVTPISGGSEIEVLENDALTDSATDCEITVTEDIDPVSYNIILNPNELSVLKNVTSTMPSTEIGPYKSNIPQTFSDGKITSKLKFFSSSPTDLEDPKGNMTVARSAAMEQSLAQSNILLAKGLQHTSPTSTNRQAFLNERNVKDRLGSDKWCASKEIFLDISQTKDMSRETSKQNISKNLGTVVVKESYIEAPRISRISKSFHGKSSTSDSYLNIAETPRRASDGVPSSSKTMNVQPEILRQKNHSPEIHSSEATGQQFHANKRHQLTTKLSFPGTAKMTDTKARKSSLTTENTRTKTRFTTTLVDETDHASGTTTLNKNASFLSKTRSVDSAAVSTSGLITILTDSKKADDKEVSEPAAVNSNLYSKRELNWFD